MENGTDGSTSFNYSGSGAIKTTNASSFAVLGLLIAAMGVLACALTIMTIIAVCKAQAIAKALRVFLVSTLGSGLLINGPLTLSCLIVVSTVFSGTSLPPLILCRFTYWAYNTGSMARSFSVSGFAIMVMLVVRYGKSTIKLPYIVLSVVAVWGLSLLLSIQYLVPQVYAVNYTVSVVCLPVLDGIFIEARVFFALLFFATAVLVPIVVCIVVPLVVLCYIKKNSITTGNEYGKAVAKLGLFLVTGIFINAIGITIISILVYIRSFGDAEVIIYSLFVIILLSLYPTPVLIVAFLKPVREKMKVFLMCLLHCLPLSWISKKSKNREAAASMPV